jgi:AAA15 family ATPase/GTPase
MLIQFTIENILSFKDMTTFSMLGTKSDLSHDNHLINCSLTKGKPVLPITAIYGANAAGKSNLTKAISFAQDLILKGTRSGKDIPVSTFKLGNYATKPSKFEFIFLYRGALYSYGFSLTSSQIIQEWLYGIPTDKKREICFFERVTDENQETTVKFGAILRKRDSQKQFLDFIAKGTRPNQLFLTEAIDRNVDTLKPVFDWFSKVLTIIPAESNFSGLEFKILASEEFTNFLSEFLKSSGTGIDSIGLDEIPADFESYLPELPKSIREEIKQEILEGSENSVVILNSPQGKRYLLTKGNNDQTKLMQLKTRHQHEEGNFVEFLIDEESEGTQRLINLIPALFLLKKNPEKVIFLDELDRRLHPLLSRRFLQFALECRGENSQNQLIFTTHDTNLLDLEILRRDEIWFVEKNPQGSSHMYSLAEFKVKPNLEVEKGYLNGRFGAIPFFGDIHNLGWLGCDGSPNS